MEGMMNSCSETLEAKISFSYVLELAADNDVEGFKLYIESNPNGIDEIGLWYGRQLGVRGMVLEYRTPLMIASMYGSLEVMKIILSLSKVDVNRASGTDKCTALHCAAYGGSVDAIDAVKLLVVNGADSNLVDAKGNRAYDVICVSRTLPHLQVALENMLFYHGSTIQKDLCDLVNDLKVSESKSPSSLMTAKSSTNGFEKKEYPVDPSLPDINNNVYTTDEFRMYSFKVRPCSRAYSHDWTECPFVHPGENARRRDPRKYHYSCVPCPEFRKGACRRGDMCEYAHGVFECWLHPAQYRTRLCKDGTSCNRRVCFFAHTPEELRPLYASTGSAVPSPRSIASGASVMDMAAALNLFPGSPSAPSPMSPSPFTPPLSPSSAGWQQQNIPTLHLPGCNIQAHNMQASRLRSSLHARDIPVEELSMFHCFSPSARSNLLPPSNLDDLFSAQQQNMLSLSPINTKPFSPKQADHTLMQQSSFGPSSPGRIASPRLSALALRDMRSLSARDLGRDFIPESPVSVASWSNWESSSNGRADWSVNGDELTRLKRSYTSGHTSEEPDLSWVQSLVKDSPSEIKEVTDSSNSNSQVESVDHSTLGAWLDQIAAQ